MQADNSGPAVIIAKAVRRRPSVKSLLSLWAAAHRVVGGPLKNPNLQGQLAFDGKVTKAVYRLSEEGKEAGPFRLFYSAVTRNNTGCLVVSLERAPFRTTDDDVMALANLRDLPAMDILSPRATPAYRVEASEVVYVGLQIACAFVANRACW